MHRHVRFPPPELFHIVCCDLLGGRQSEHVERWSPAHIAQPRTNSRDLRHSQMRLLPPQTESLEDALRQLHVIGGIDRDGAITQDGRAMAGLPLDPALAAAALAAAELGCLPDLLTVAAMLSADTIFAGGRCMPLSLPPPLPPPPQLAGEFPLHARSSVNLRMPLLPQLPLLTQLSDCHHCQCADSGVHGA